MYGRTRYIVIALVVILVFLLGLLLFRGGKRTTTKSTTGTTVKLPKKITEYNDSTSYVRLTMDGSVNAEQTHRMIRITVSQNQSNLDIFQGYQFNNIGSNTFSSNKDAYNDFLNALYHGNFDKDRVTKNTDYAGMCPLGTRYIFEVYDAGDRVSQRWSASCNGMGTFGGNSGLMLSLFKAQIPGYAKLTNGVVL